MLLIPVRVKLHKGADAAAHCIELCTQIAHSQGLSTQQLWCETAVSRSVLPHGSEKELKRSCLLSLSSR